VQTQSRESVQDLKYIGKNVTDLGLFKPKKLITEGFLVLERCEG
jgi:hypothetical protein